MSALIVSVKDSLTEVLANLNQSAENKKVLTAVQIL
jgi:hypothetical protein